MVHFHPLKVVHFHPLCYAQFNPLEVVYYARCLQPTNIWYKENVCLIGDSAHATTPNMGQGACQAIEDAYVLSEYIYKYGITKAFPEYQKLRLPKAHQVVKTSRLMGKIAHLENPILIGLRNQMLRLIPSSVIRKQNEQIFKLAKI